MTLQFVICVFFCPWTGKYVPGTCCLLFLHVFVKLMCILNMQLHYCVYYLSNLLYSYIYVHMCVSCVFTFAQGLQGLQKSLFAWFWVVLPPGPCAKIRWTFQNAVEHSCFDPSRFSMIDSLNPSGLVLPPKLEPRGNCVDALRFFSTFLEHIRRFNIFVYLFRKGGTYPLIGAAIKTQGWPISKQGQHLRSFSLVKLHSFCLRPTVLQFHNLDFTSWAKHVSKPSCVPWYPLSFWCVGRTLFSCLFLSVWVGCKQGCATALCHVMAKCFWQWLCYKGWCSSGIWWICLFQRFQWLKTGLAFHSLNYLLRLL